MPMSVLAMDTIGHLPATSKGNRWAVTAMCLHTSYMFTILMKEKSAENVIQAYFSGISAHKGKSEAILKVKVSLLYSFTRPAYFGSTLQSYPGKKLAKPWYEASP